MKGKKRDYNGRLKDKYASDVSLLPGLCYDVALICLAWACRFDYASLSCLNSRFNVLMKSGYIYELRKQLEIKEHWVYIVCDPRRWEAFDPISKMWMRLPRIPCDEYFNHADKESLAVGSELLVFGRKLFQFAIWKHSLIHRNWVKCEGMSLPRCLFASASFGSIAIVAGGNDQTGNILKSVELYDSSSSIDYIFSTKYKYIYKYGPCSPPSSAHGPPRTQWNSSLPGSRSQHRNL